MSSRVLLCLGFYYQCYMCFYGVLYLLTYWHSTTFSAVVKWPTKSKLKSATHFELIQLYRVVGLSYEILALLETVVDGEMILDNSVTKETLMKVGMTDKEAIATLDAFQRILDNGLLS